MRSSRVLLCTLLLHCVEPPPDRPPQAPSVLAPSCVAVGSDDAFAFEAFFGEVGVAIVTVQQASGSVVVVRRDDIDVPGPVTLAIGHDALDAGRNRVTLWLENVARRSAARTFEIHRYDLAGAALFDADGDCVPAGADCNDASSALRPGAAERCDDLVDNDCNGLVDAADAACSTTCADSDRDGFTRVDCGGSDCDDGDPSTHPAAVEACNGRDDDCDGNFDELFDADLDNFAACPSFIALTRRVDGSACPMGMPWCADCDDADASLHPGAFTGACTQ